LIFGAKVQFASKVLVAPKVGFLPQKSFHHLIELADYDLQPQFCEFVSVLAAWVHFDRFVD
jgi:hypothetical protein